MRITDVLTAASAFALGFILLLGPAMRASAAELAASGADQRTAVVPAPDVELKALEDTLTFDQRWFARPNDTAGALTPSAGGRSSAEAEPDALMAATMAENAARGPTSAAHAWGNGLGGDVPAAETELHALFSWQWRSTSGDNGRS